ncbi:MAG: four-carbon acid sugar kinase family protein [Massilia sp.]|nr:four-carbon acid sugar kinase family protein [Massilia sp.]
MSQILIIADDLSGAADCASAFFKAGHETLVVIDWKVGQCAGTHNTQVIAIDADTRRLVPQDAAAVHRKMFERYRSPGQLLYKKIDSTLRGNFAQELAAIVKDAGLAIVAPAFPLAGRFTRRGHQYLNDVPLENSEVWRTEGIAGTAHIPGMLSRQGIKTASIEIEDIRRGPSRILTLLEQFGNAGIEAVVCDVETDQDLQVIAQASMDLTVPHFYVGSAGLTYHLATAGAAPLGTVSAPSVVTRGAILTVVGSLSNVSREQAQYLEESARLACLEIPADVLREGQSHSRWNEFHDAVGQLLRDQRDLLVVIEKGTSVNMSEGLDLCQALAALIAPLADHIGAVISTGGETARAILSAIGSKGLYLAGEIESGVPLSVAAGIKPIPVITKAGAFGSLETLQRCYQRLREARIDDAVPAGNSLQRKS